MAEELKIGKRVAHYGGFQSWFRSRTWETFSSLASGCVTKINALPGYAHL